MEMYVFVLWAMMVYMNIKDLSKDEENLKRILSEMEF